MDSDNPRGKPMNQSIFKPTALSSAVALSLGSTSALAVPPTEVNINNMLFGTTNYAAAGTLKDDGTGTMNSVDPFFYHTWTSSQQTVFLDSTDTWNGSSAQGPYDYDADLAGMTANQFGVGLFFNWNGQNDIAVLEIFDCDSVPGTCAGQGVAMDNGPFAGSVAAFSGGPAPISCQNLAVSELVPDTQILIPLADIFAGCTDVSGTATIGAFDADSPVGSTVTNDGTNLVYTPASAFQGSDQFGVTVADDVNTFDIVIDVQVGGKLQNNFTMLDSGGAGIGGTNDVDFTWDDVFSSSAVDAKGIPTDTDFSHVTLASGYPFFGAVWEANHIRIFQGPGTFTFDVSCTAADYDNGIVDCNRPLAPTDTSQYLEMTLADDEIGAHILFDWNGNLSIDVVNVWRQNEKWDTQNALYQGPAGVIPSDESTWRFVSVDADGDGVNGIPMVDGAFVGSNANFNIQPDRVACTPPDCPTDSGIIGDVKTGSFSMNLWGLVTGLFGLIGLRRYARSRAQR